MDSFSQFSLSYQSAGGNKFLKPLESEGNCIPRWDFKCDRCGRTVERAFSSLEEASRHVEYCLDDTNCCGRMIRQLPSGSFILKGEGFYKPSKD